MVIDIHDNAIVLAKIALIGPAGSGKSTALKTILGRIPAENRGEVNRIDSHKDTILSVEVVPGNLPEIGGKTLQLQIATVTGPVRTLSTCQRLLQDADGIIFVADSTVGLMRENTSEIERLNVTLSSLGVHPGEVPAIMLFNKRDAKRVYTLEELNAKLNPGDVPGFETVASSGYGVFRALKAIVDMVVENLQEQESGEDHSTSGPGNGEAQGFTFESPDTSDSGDDPDDGGKGVRSSFSFPATKRTADGSGPSAPFEPPEGGDEEGRGGIWSRISTRFRK